MIEKQSLHCQHHTSLASIKTDEIPTLSRYGKLLPSTQIIVLKHIWSKTRARQCRMGTSRQGGSDPGGPLRSDKSRWWSNRRVERMGRRKRPWGDISFSLGWEQASLLYSCLPWIALCRKFLRFL